MIVNLPANTVNSNESNSLAAMETNQGQCELNFLKRKLTIDNTSLGSQHLESTTENTFTTEVYHGSGQDDLWKKRHIDTSDSCFNINSFFANGNEAADLLSTVSTTVGCTNSTNINVNNNNNNSNSSTDLTFNLLSSAFINDLFGYEANNLIVPVTSCTTSAVATTYVTPTNVCYEDGSNWQATDLLELDHRYNSGLQNDSTQISTQNSNPEHQNRTQDQHKQQQMQKDTFHNQSHPQQHQREQSEMDFLAPQKQTSSHSNSPTGQSVKYRHHQQTPTESESDFEDKNLSWLLNFKFDELPHLSPDLGSTGNVGQQGSDFNGSVTQSKSSNGTSLNGSVHNQSSSNDRSRSPKNSSKVGKKFEELVLEATSEMDSGDVSGVESALVEETSIRAPKKPPFTYTELIEYALEDKGELTVSGIYQWISDRFPYYKSNDDRWKNSVRHNLSINPHFRKGAKAPQGAGHLWTISSGDSAENVLAWEHKKQRLDLFFKMESMNRERLQQHQQQLQQQQHEQQRQNNSPQQNGIHQNCNSDQCLYDETATATAVLTQEMMNQTQQQQQHSLPEQHQCNLISRSTDNQRYTTTTHVVHELPYNDLLSDDELRKTAGQILNGIHREVEVQSVNSIISTPSYQDVLLDNEDYLNPIHKDVIVNESGLRSTVTTTQRPSNHSSQYYITEIDPLELGIQMSHRIDDEAEVLFNDDFNLNYFGYNAGNDIVA